MSFRDLRAYTDAAYLARQILTTGGQTGSPRVVTTLHATGHVQPEAAELANKKSFLEDNPQFPRKVMVAGPRGLP